MTAHQILRIQGSAVHAVSPTASPAQATVLLGQRGVGALVVLDGPALLGVLPERDIVRAIGEHGAAALSRPVAAEMTAGVETCAPQTTVRKLMARMTRRRVRHLPVVDGGLVVGIVSIGDVVKRHVEEVQGDVSLLQDALTVRWASALAA